MLFSLFQAFTGTVRLRVRGMYAVRFCNRCLEEGIPLWDIRSDETGQILSITVRLWDFPRLREPARACAVRLHLLRKRGLLFTLHRTRKRIMLWCGLFALLAVFYTLTSFVWTIEVTGNEEVSRAQILRALEDYGFGVGTRVDTVDAEYLRNEILADMHELCWLTVRLRGSHAVVEVRERITVPAPVDDQTPCDIVAGESGLVTLMRVRAGAPVVEKDTIVEKGQLLVSADVPYADYVVGIDPGGYQVHAAAEVYARIWNDCVCTSPVEVCQKVYTGRSHRNWALEIGSLRINFSYNSSIDTVNCDKIVERTRLQLLPGLTLPLVWVTETIRPYDRVCASLDTAVLEAALTQAASARLSQLLAGSQITPVSARTYVGDNHVRARVTVETTRDIAVTVIR